MRPGEAILLATLALVCFPFLFPAAKRPRWVRTLPLVAAIALGLQLALEGFRWQMAPAILLAAALFQRAIIGARHAARRSGSPGPPRDRLGLRLTGVALAFLLLFASTALTRLFPFPELPEPTGPHSVGLADYFVIDEDRPETFTTDPDDRRSLSIRLWYPASKPAHATPVSYGEKIHAIGRLITRGTPWPSFVFNDRALVDTHSYRGAEPVSEPRRFPVLIFSHAYWAGISQSFILMQELASHGYAVVSVAHAYETPYSIDGDGRIVGYDRHNPQIWARGEERARGYPLERSIVATDDPVETERLFRELARARPRTLASLAIWSDDVSFVIDELGRLDAAGMFEGRLDLERIGVFGHSFGGTTAGEVCLRDTRCKAGCNLDGLQMGRMLDEDLDRPFLFVHHDNPSAINKTPNRRFFERSRADAYLLLVRGTRHLDFSDLTIYGRGSLLRRSGMLGELDGARCLRIQFDYVRAFFDKHLKDDDSGLLDGPSPEYPEVEILVRRTDPR